MIICFALVVVQLGNIQFRRASALANSQFNPQVAVKKFDNNRGTIFLSDGTVLAQSVKSTTGPYHYMREYPAATGQLYSGITGYDSIFFGTTGIEYEYNQYLESHPQAPQNLSQVIFNKPPSEPDNVMLTIDPVLQQAAYDALTTLPPGPDKDGAVVVLNPTTGAVLAMVSNPTFDPAPFASPDVTTERGYDYGESIPDPEGFSHLRPLATQERFPPGSTFKVVDSTAVYNLKPSLENFSFPPAVSVKFPDGLAIHNDGNTPCGGTMIVMLPASCDPGYAALGVQLGVPILTEQAQKFGFSISDTKDQYVPTLDLPNVIPSTFSNLPVGSQALLGQSALGQYNDAATPLGNALVAAGIADGGVIMTPHLMEQIRDSQGNIVATYHPTPMLTAASQSAAATVTDLMQGVASHGTAAGIFPAAWDVAVKTGTAQVPGKVEQTDDWMIGFMPAKGTPQLAIAVVVPYQTQDLTGAVVAGPIVKKVFQAYLSESAGQP
ncbi:MAG TPA: penicillin-binding transpeptidase domain-containing protein [Acidimicrobiales bacterium]|jgi:peptidoglycan glycosyltransferase|nr:penicillin-binding transpeptidase domain-containing protein [Acidimicrobiales bacterium]